MLAKKLHDLNYLIMPLILIIAVLFSSNILIYFFILFVLIINILILIPKIKILPLCLFCISLLPVLLAMFISVYCYTTPEINGITPNRILTAINMSLRLFLLSIISFAFVFHANTDRVMLYFMQRKILNVKIGYACMSAFNTFRYLGLEFKKIQLANQMRYKRYMYSPKIIIPLLVVASRHSHSLSVSMYNRGLNQKRSYYTRIPNLSIYDYTYIILNIIAILYIIK